MVTNGGREGQINWEIRTDVYTLPCVKQIASRKVLYSTGSSVQCSVMTWRGRMGVGRSLKREWIYICGSFCYKAETHTTF